MCTKVGEWFKIMNCHKSIRHISVYGKTLSNMALGELLTILLISNHPMQFDMFNMRSGLGEHRQTS